MSNVQLVNRLIAKCLRDSERENQKRAVGQIMNGQQLDYKLKNLMDAPLKRG
jgi:hypothetical protein